MNNQNLKKLIKEEILKILSEEDQPENSSLDSSARMSGAEFNKSFVDFFLNLRKDKAGLGQTELQNLIDLFELLVEYARDRNLTQFLEDRIRLVLDPQGKIQAGIDSKK
jgi:hypothetical protein